MPFKPGNSHWRERKVSRGGRPTREEAKEKMAKEEAMERGLEIWANEIATRYLEQSFGRKDAACHLCGETP